MISLSQQFTQVVLVATAIYFFAGLVINLAQAQLSTATGDRAGYAHALQQGILMVILLVVAGSLGGLTEPLKAALQCSDGSAPSAVVLWKLLAKLVVSLVVGGAGIFTTISLVWSGVELQVSFLLGAPGSVASGLRRMVVLLGGGILTLSAVFLANTVLSLFW